MTETSYIYAGLLIGTILFVGIPYTLLEVQGGVEDIQPYGIFVTIINIFDAIASLINFIIEFVLNLFIYPVVGTLSLVDTLPVINLEDTIDSLLGFRVSIIEGLGGFQVALFDGMIKLAKIYTLIPLPLFLIILIPYTGAIIYAFIKALPTT